MLGGAPLIACIVSVSLKSNDLRAPDEGPRCRPWLEPQWVQPGRSVRETSATDRQMAGAMRSLLKQTAAAVSKPMRTATTAEAPDPEEAAPAGAAPRPSGTKPRG